MQSFRHDNSGPFNSQNRRCPKCGLQVTEGARACPQDGTPIFAAPGTKLAERYEFLEVSGWGGMSIIYKARHRLSNQIVAIKMLHSLMMTEQSLKRFQQEADAISSLRHPNIISVHEFGLSDQGQPYMVMDFIEGENLSDVIKRKGSLSLDECLHRFIQLCDALQHAHDLGILHRDLKPSNIMLSNTAGNFEDARIVDFGIAKLLDRSEEDGQLTQTGELFGSPCYMSPEQCRGVKIDSRTDIYSMGCMMYETLTGQPPFNGNTVVETIMKQINEPAPTLSQGKRGTEFSPKLENIVRKALAKNPGDRFQTMNDLELALMQVQTESPDTAILNEKQLPRFAGYGKIIKIGTITALMLALLGGMIGYISWQNGFQHGRSITKAPVHLQQALNPYDERSNRLILLGNWDRRALTDSFLLSQFHYPHNDFGIKKWDLNGTKVSTDALKYVNEMESLTEVYLDDTLIDDKALERLSRLPNLEIISARNTKVTNTGLGYLVGAKKLKKLYLSGTEMNDSSVALLKSHQLSDLDLSHSDISDSGVQEIAKISSLSALDLHDTNVTDAGLKYLKDLSQLKELHLDQNPVSDTGAGYLVGCHSLEKLYLDQTNITDKGLAKLAQLDSLKELYLDLTLVTDEGMKEVPKFHNLNRLVIKHDAITDGGLDPLIESAKLTNIECDGVDITDRGLKKLEKDSKLSYLNISSCRHLSPGAIRAFASALPKCQIGDWRDYDQQARARLRRKKKQ